MSIDDEGRKFWERTYLTGFNEPCAVCGKMPAEGDVWKIENEAGEKIREGHKECLERNP